MLVREHRGRMRTEALWLLVLSLTSGCGRSTLPGLLHDDGDADAGDPGGATCVPSTEVCNGVDDDCDGVVDEGCNTNCGTLADLNDTFDDGATGTGWVAEPH